MTTPNPDYDRMDACYTLLDRIKDQRGLPQSVLAADAAVTTLRDIACGAAVATKAAGTVRAQYKAPAAHPGDVALNAACGTHGDPKIIALLQRAAQASPAQLDQVLRMLDGGQPLKPTATVTDSGRQSVPATTKHYDPQTDAYARLMGADQTKGH